MRDSNHKFTGPRQLARPYQNVFKEIILPRGPILLNIIHNFTLQHFLKMYYLLHCKQLRVELWGCLGRLWKVWHLTGHHSAAQRELGQLSCCRKSQDSHSSWQTRKHQGTQADRSDMAGTGRNPKKDYPLGMLQTSHEQYAVVRFPFTGTPLPHS